MVNPGCIPKNILAGGVIKILLSKIRRFATGKVTGSTFVNASGLHHIILACLPSMVSNEIPNKSSCLLKRQLLSLRR